MATLSKKEIDSLTPWRLKVLESQNNANKNRPTPKERTKQLSNANLYVGAGLGVAVKAVSAVQSIGLFTSPLNKLWRAAILIHRVSSPHPKLDAQERKGGKYNDLSNLHYAREGSFSRSQLDNPWNNIKIKAFYSGMSPFEIKQQEAFDLTKNTPSKNYEIQNQIIIINPNTNPATSLVLQNRPSEINIEPTSNWAVVKSMGRNNPFMMYTGGEDTISFEISWYATDKSREEVLTKCRLLESWSKADGYNASPPTLFISWGRANIFKNHTFILQSASYTLSNFQNATRTVSNMNKSQTHKGSGIEDKTIYKYHDLGLLPNLATQRLTFKRVTEGNLTHVEMVDPEVLKNTKGII